MSIQVTFNVKDVNELSQLVSMLQGNVPVQETPAPAPVQETPAPAPPVQETPAPVNNEMPAPPTFEQPVQETPACPFTDEKGLTAYVMEVYQQLGAQKGSQIQTVLANIGCQHLTEVKPEQYSTLYKGIEALKNG